MIRFGLAIAVLVLLPRVAGAQANDSPRFLPRAAFSFGWGGLVTDDKRFDWHGRVGVDFDVVRVRAWRVSFRGEYEAFLGRERRRYDLNQGNYFFEAALARRVGPIELQALMQHVSRHVVDRDNVPAISWNLAGVRAHASHTFSGDRVVAGELEAGRYTQPAFIDYAWTARANVSLRDPVTPRVSVIGRASGEVIGVRRAIAGRPRICGGRVEIALRVKGGAADVEFFGGYERRIDAFPTDRFRVRWFTVGFRVVQ